MPKTQTSRRVAIGNKIDGSEETDQTIWLNLPELVVSRLLIQANSGGGKSYLVRRLLEQTHGRIQQIVIDVEGEFGSLREKFDYVYAAKEGGDTTVDPRGASMLAERLLELKVSAILDIYELKHVDRIRFVHLFLDALVNAPKHLWHPVLVVIDEAHIFCPQADEVESSESVMGICTRGRKRGYCAVLATQRLSKLHKDAAAECNNRLIGRASLDVDIKRASDTLGFARKEQRQTLPRMNPGEFYAFGPAISSTVVTVKVGPVVTKHPKAGGRIRFAAPRPTARIKKLLPKLADLPELQTERDKTARELKKELIAAQARVASLEDSTAPRVVPMLTPKVIKRLDALTLRITRTAGWIESETKSLIAAGAQLQQAGNAFATRLTATGAAVTPQQREDSPAVQREIARSGAPTRLLAAIKAFPGAGHAKLGAVAHISPRQSTFRVAIGRLKRENLIRGDKIGYWLTVEGEKAAATLPAPPSGAISIVHWRERLGNGVKRRIFDSILAAGYTGISAEDIGRDTGVDTEVSTFRLAIRELKHHDLVSGDRAAYHITKELL